MRWSTARCWQEVESRQQVQLEARPRAAAFLEYIYIKIMYASHLAVFTRLDWRCPQNNQQSQPQSQLECRHHSMVMVAERG